MPPRIPVPVSNILFMGPLNLRRIELSADIRVHYQTPLTMTLSLFGQLGSIISPFIEVLCKTQHHMIFHGHLFQIPVYAKDLQHQQQ